MELVEFLKNKDLGFVGRAEGNDAFVEPEKTELDDVADELLNPDQRDGQPECRQRRLELHEGDDRGHDSRNRTASPLLELRRIRHAGQHHGHWIHTECQHSAGSDPLSGWITGGNQFRFVTAVGWGFKPKRHEW